MKNTHTHPFRLFLSLCLFLIGTCAFAQKSISGKVTAVDDGSALIGASVFIKGSTVGTVTEIYYYFRLLFARVGVQHCHQCGRKIQSVGVDQIVDMIYALPEASKLQILAPLLSASNGEHKDVLETARKERS